MRIRKHLDHLAAFEELILSIGIAAFGVCFFLYALTGFHNRYIADDYWTAALLDQYGFWHSQAVLYTGWSGRFSSIFLDQLLQSLGFNVAKLLPPITLGVWMVVVLALITSIHEIYYAGRDRKVSVFVACSTLFTLIYTAPNLFQSFYWRTGIITYPIPLIILLVFLRMVLSARAGDQKNTLLQDVLIFGLLVFAGGMSETNLVVQTIVIGVLFANIALDKNRSHAQQLRLLAVGLIASVVSMAIVASSPGNQVRQSFFPPHQPFSQLVPRTFIEAFKFGATSLFTSKTVIAFFIFTVWALLTCSRRQPRDLSDFPSRDLLVGVAIVVLSLLACFGLSLYTMTSLPPLRTLFVPKAILIATVLLLAYAIALRISKQKVCTNLLNRSSVRMASGLVILILLGVGPGLTAVRLGSALPEWAKYSREWDQRQQYLSKESSNRKKDIVIKTLHHPEELSQLAETAVEIQGDLQLGENKNLAELYRFEHVWVVR